MVAATVGRMNRWETFSPASRGSVVSLTSASRAELACTEVMPGIPELKAIRRSRHSSWTDLADDQPVGPHPQRLLDQAALADLLALQVGLPGLHGHRVRQPDLELEHLLAGDHPRPRRDGRGQAVEGGRLAGLGGPGDDDVEPG